MKLKTWLNNLQIRYKLTLLMTTISVVTIVVASLMIATNQIATIKQSAIDNTTAKARIIASSAESSILFNDAESAQDTLNRLANDSSIDYAAIVLPDLTNLASYQNADLENIPTVNFGQAYTITSEYLEVTHSIFLQKEVIGYVFIRSNVDAVNKQLVSFSMIMFIVLFISLVLAYLLSIFFQRIITNPIQLMVKRVEEIYTTSDYGKRLELGTDDEFGKIAVGFNHLLSIVQQRENALKEHGEHLQELVNIRTFELQKEAHFDSLTGLPNRYLLMERLQQAIAESHRNHKKLAILFLDLDRFKIINDSLGHSVGDQMLISVASRITQVMREGDTIARLGGDEFVFLVKNIDQAEVAARVAQRIINKLSTPLELEAHVLHMSTSIGISVYPQDGFDQESLLKNADIAMYHAKEQGPGRYFFYKEEINKASVDRLSLENKLRKAIPNEEFFLVYQPIVNTANQTIESVEALIRWKNPELGLVSPDNFISIAEEIGIISDIGCWVISSACKQLSRWAAIGIDYIKIAINLSASHLMDVSLLDYIETETTKWNIECQQLKIEITEDVFLNHSERIISTLDKIRQMGIKISIDDFGTGYSSLRYLQQFPVDTLKIDGMFIKNICSDNSSRGIVSSTILLAHSLGLSVVCECVENEAQFRFLSDNKSDFIQGYYLYRPLPPEELEKILIRNSDCPAATKML